MSDKDSLEQPPEEGIEIEPMDEFDCLELEKTIINEWGMQRSSLNRMIYCGITVRCMEVIQDAEINELFNDPRMLGQKVIFKHRIKELQTNALLQLVGARKRRHASSEMSFNQKLDDNPPTNPPPIHPNSMPHQPKKMKLEDDDDDDDEDPLLTDTSLLEPEQSLEASDQAIRLHDHHPTPMQNGSFIKPTTANAMAGNLPIRISVDGLRQLLQASRQGQWVLSYYNTYHTMNRKIQAALTHCIVEQFLVYNIMFSHRLMRHYAVIITQLFPTECAEVYYKPAQTLGWKRTCASGKLMDRWANQRMRHKDRYPQQRPRILDDTSDQRTFAEMSLVMGQAALGGL
ncbi:hypothetical protein RP20_CCG007056 [Aedes albopictus]|nr:uncharacterized protein LOC109418989 [Aedes albopictus]KXJ83322.1 hypothetical protein RP20_CCG007056 [Aedes albopictus]